MSREKSPKGDFFREGGRGEPPYPPYHKNLGCQGEIAKPGCQGKSFDANFLEKDLANLGSSAYAIRMKIELDYKDLTNINLALATRRHLHESFLSSEHTSEKGKEYYREKLEEIKIAQKKIQSKMLGQ